MNNFTIICKKCGLPGEPVEILLRHDGGCGDPDCCGERNYLGVTLKYKCGNTEEIDCEVE